MWQQSQSLFRWLPSVLALTLLAACAQNPTPTSENPTTTQPDTTAASPLEPSPVPTPLVKPSPAGTPTATSPAKPTATAPTTSRSTASVPTPVKPSAAPVTASTFSATPSMLGFSPDSNYFVYLESSRDTGAGIPKSSLQVVDMASNDCVQNACIETRYDEKDAGMDTTAAEADLLKRTWKVRQDLKLTPPVAGTALPIQSRSRLADGSEIVTVRPSDSSQPLKLHLRQRSQHNEAAMQLEVSYDGQQRSIGSLSHYRNSVLGYTIREVRLAPDGKHIAVLLTAVKPSFEGTLGTTLVQGFALN